MLDAGGNLAIASGDYALEQDVASAARLFQGELWYNTAKGLPYWAQILGKSVSLPLLRAKYIAAALTVSDVVSATCTLFLNNRRVTGNISFVGSSGTVGVVAV